MAQQYQPKRFFRQAPNLFLKRFFNERHEMLEFKFESLGETQIDPLYQAWLEIPEGTRNEMEGHFQDIDDLASEKGTKAIIDEALWHGEDLAIQFATLTGFHEHAFWTFLERPKFWRGALAFHHADTIPGSYWRKRKNLPRKTALVEPADLQKLEQGIGQYFHTMQGRGKNCRVEPFRRNALDYFFAYPEDYAQASVEWVGKDFQRRPRNPAFEIIFVYSQEDGTLDLYLTGDRKPIPDLQEMFAKIILNAELGPDEKDDRIYDLKPVLTPEFEFVIDPASGIESVAVKKIRLKALGRDERITLEANPAKDELAIFDMLEKLQTVIPVNQMSITQIGFLVTFAPNPNSKRIPTRSFEISWPNSCSLKHDKRDLEIRKMLSQSGIEPMVPELESAVA